MESNIESNFYKFTSFYNDVIDKILLREDQSAFHVIIEANDEIEASKIFNEKSYLLNSIIKCEKIDLKTFIESSNTIDYAISVFETFPYFTKKEFIVYYKNGEKTNYYRLVKKNTSTKENESLFKKTQDNWYPNINEDEIKLSFQKGEEENEFYISCWGDDDFGMDKFYENEETCFSEFEMLKQKEFINIQDLENLGFTNY